MPPSVPAGNPANTDPEHDGDAVAVSNIAADAMTLQTGVQQSGSDPDVEDDPTSAPASSALAITASPDEISIGGGDNPALDPLVTAPPADIIPVFELSPPDPAQMDIFCDLEVPDIFRLYAGTYATGEFDGVGTCNEQPGDGTQFTIPVLDYQPTDFQVWDLLFPLLRAERPLEVVRTF